MKRIFSKKVVVLYTREFFLNFSKKLIFRSQNFQKNISGEKKIGEKIC
jgi:hypothetical protein